MLQSFLEKWIEFAKDLGRLAIKSHAANQANRL